MDIAERTSSFWRFARKLPSGFWQFVRKLSAQVPLRYSLIVAELALVGIALAVISVTGINYLRNYLVQRENQQVESQADSLLLQTNVQSYLGAELAGGGQQQHESTQVAADWLANGKIYRAIYPVSGYSDVGVPEPVSGPSISVNASWLATYQPVVVGAQAGSGHWDVVSTPLVVLGPNGPIDGTLVVGIDITPTYSTLNRLAGTDILVSVILLLGLLVFGIVIIRRSLRPLADIKQTADAVSAGDLAQRMPEAGSRTEFGSTGRSFNQMLGHLEAAVRARSRSERAARRSEQRTRNLLADLSHELRTPLTAIRGFAEYYRHRGRAHGSAWEPSHRGGRAGASAGSGSGDGVPPSHNGSGPQVPPDLERIIGRVEQEADRMAELLEDMLLLADLGQEVPLDSQPVDLLTLTEDAVREARLTAPNTTVNLDSSDAGADPDAPPESDGVLPVAGDKAQLRKIIGIMTRNALAQAPEGTAIDVRVATAGRAEIRSALSAAEAEPDTWPGFLTMTDRDESPDEPAAAVLEVTDHGRSLTEEQSKYAFDRYYRVSTAGSGLDLTVVATVISAHGGAAWVMPQATRGTTYCIAVPLLRPAPEADDDQAGAAAEAGGLPAGHVVGKAGMTVSNLAGSAGTDTEGADGADGAAVAGVPGEEQEGPTWVESGPPDEISFLAASSAGRAAQDRASGAQRRPSRAERGLPVPRPEQVDVHEQRVQLMERDPSPPPVCQRRAADVAGQHPVEVGRPEQAEHGQVGFPVTAVRGRVDEPAATA
jgi:two-component system, OmpR family, sensor kinase